MAYVTSYVSCRLLSVYCSGHDLTSATATAAASNQQPGGSVGKQYVRPTAQHQCWPTNISCKMLIVWMWSLDTDTAA